MSCSIPLAASLPLRLFLATWVFCSATLVVLIGLTTPTRLSIRFISLRIRALSALRDRFSRTRATAGTARGLLGGGARRHGGRHVLASIGGRGTVVRGVDRNRRSESGARVHGRIALRRGVSLGGGGGAVAVFSRRAFGSWRRGSVVLGGSMISVAAWRRV